jgi:hypothetical protein
VTAPISQKSGLCFEVFFLDVLILLGNYFGVCATADYFCDFYFYVFVSFCVAYEDWESFDFGYAFSVWAHIDDVHFKFVSNFKGVINSSASILGISWGSFFWAKSASSSL